MRKHRHIGAYGIIIKEENILLIKKSRGAYTGKLDLPGGSFEHGETPEECVIREIMEETELEVIATELFDAVSNTVAWDDPVENDVEDLHHLGILYLITCKDLEKIKEDSDGLDSLGAVWCNINEVTKEELSPFAYYAVLKMRKEV